MKKEYVKPEMMAIALSAESILQAVSRTTTFGEEPATDPAFSRDLEEMQVLRGFGL